MFELSSNSAGERIKMAGENGECLEKDTKGELVEKPREEKLFTLKKWNAVAMWSWDVECDTCAICRVQVMGNIEI